MSGRKTFRDIEVFVIGYEGQEAVASALCSVMADKGFFTSLKSAPPRGSSRVLESLVGKRVRVHFEAIRVCKKLTIKIKKVHHAKCK